MPGDEVEGALRVLDEAWSSMYSLPKASPELQDERQGQKPRSAAACRRRSDGLKVDRIGLPRGASRTLGLRRRLSANR